MDRRHRDPGVQPGCRRGRPRGRDGDLGNEATPESRRTCWIQGCPRRMTRGLSSSPVLRFLGLGLAGSREFQVGAETDRRSRAKRGHSWTRPAPPPLILAGCCAVARHGATWHREPAATPPAERAVPGTGRASAAPRPPVRRSGGWYSEPFETREVRKARERADRAARRADRAARRVHEAQERAGGQRSGARQLVDAAGDAATAALTAVSAAADEAQARLAAKARMRELEHAVVTARAGGPVDVSPPTREEALKLARPGGSWLVRGIVRPGRRVHPCRDRGAHDDDDRRVRLAGRCRAGGDPHRRWLAGRPTPDGGPEPQGGPDPARARARQPRFDRTCSRCRDGSGGPRRATRPSRWGSGGDGGTHRRTAEADRGRRPADPR